MTITDHAGIAITYDRRIHQLIRKLARKRSSATDYFSILNTAQPDVKAAVMRDFEFNADLQKKEKEKEKNDKEKTKKDAAKGKGEGSKGKGEKAPDEPAKTTGRWGATNGRRTIGATGTRFRKKRRMGGEGGSDSESHTDGGEGEETGWEEKEVIRSATPPFTTFSPPEKGTPSHHPVAG